MTTPRRVTAGLVLGSMLVIFLACDHRTPTEPSGSEVAFQTVLKGSLAGQSPNLQGREAIRDQATWQAVWTELHSLSPQPLPEVDFNREMVVVVLGPGCTGTVEVSSIVSQRGELVVNAQAKACSNNLCFAADFSAHVVRLPRSEAPVRLNVRSDVKLC